MAKPIDIMDWGEMFRQGLIASASTNCLEDDIAYQYYALSTDEKSKLLLLEINHES